MGIDPSPLYEPIPDPGWIILEKDEVKINRFGSSILSLGFDIPSGYCGKKLEGIVLIEPEEGKAVFVRIKMTIDAK